jgi:histidine triad (HIT) family protein
MNDCKFCQLLASGALAAKLPNLIVETPHAVAALNRRPLAPSHVTVILKAHHDRTSQFADADLSGVGDLLGRLSAALEKIHSPARVALVGDGKTSAHVHLHLLPLMPGAPVDLGAAVGDLNQATRPNTLSDADVAAGVTALREALPS